MAKNHKRSSYILFDIDETIRGHHSESPLIDERLVPLLLKLRQKGYRLGIVTGRPFMFYREYIAELQSCMPEFDAEKLISIVIYENGHRAYARGRHQQLIDIRSRYELWRLRRHIKHHLTETSGVEADQQLSLPRSALRGQTIITLSRATIPSGGNSETLASLFNSIPAIGQHNLKRIRLSVINNSLMTLESRSSTKATAVQKLIREKSLIFCCDGENDQELAKFVLSIGGQVVCPENAVPAIKSIASYIADGKYSTGICNFLELLVK